MATDLEIMGPIVIPFKNNGKRSAKYIGNAEVKEFRDTDEAQEVAQKQGCYIFALQAGRGYRPWYVGKATKSVLFKGRKGTSVVFFVALGALRACLENANVSILSKLLNLYRYRALP